jgi:hypothetical protein
MSSTEPTYAELVAEVELDQRQMKALASQAMNDAPEVYTAVTGLPIWWDPFGPEYKKAQAKWLRFVTSEVRKMQAEASK